MMVVSYPLRRPRGFALLSSNEFDVVEAVISGLSQAEIARREGVSQRTVANQLASAYAKLGIGSAAELSVLCSEWLTVKHRSARG